jgi:hypothetical protein
MGVKLFVGNLPYSTTEDELATLFARAGTVESVVIITDRATGQSRGFAFLEMSTVSEAQSDKHVQRLFPGQSRACGQPGPLARGATVPGRPSRRR